MTEEATKQPTDVDVEPTPSPNFTPTPCVEKVHQLAARDLQTAAIIVFVLSSFALLALLFMFNAAYVEAHNYHYFRSAELILTLGATSLIVAIVARSRNPFVLTFGIF